MKTYILKRLLMMIPTMFGITVITFAIIRLAPGDPAALKIGSAGEGSLRSQQMAEAIIERTRKEFELDKPIHVQYWHWVKRIFKLDFGRSYKDNRPVWDKIKERLPITIQLNVISIILGYLIAIPLGIFSATHEYSFSDKILTVILYILYSLPSFWVATILILYFCGGDYLHVFPLTGLNSMGAASMGRWPWLLDRMWHLVLPVFCLTYGELAFVSRLMRASMLETIRQDFIRTARAKGLSEKVVVYKHAFRNSLISIVTVLGFLLPALFGGSVIIESIFTIPGMGQLGFEAILSRDYPVVMAISTIAAFLTMLGLLVSDVLYAIVNPTISLESQ